MEKIKSDLLREIDNQFKMHGYNDYKFYENIADDLNINAEDKVNTTLILKTGELQGKPWPLFYQNNELTLLTLDRMEIRNDKNKYNILYLDKLIRDVLVKNEIHFERSEIEHQTDTKLLTLKYNFWLLAC